MLEEQRNSNLLFRNRTDLRSGFYGVDSGITTHDQAQKSHDQVVLRELKMQKKENLKSLDLHLEDISDICSLRSKFILPYLTVDSVQVSTRSSRFSPGTRTATFMVSFLRSKTRTSLRNSTSPRTPSSAVSTLKAQVRMTQRPSNLPGTSSNLADTPPTKSSSTSTREPSPRISQ